LINQRRRLNRKRKPKPKGLLFHKQKSDINFTDPSSFKENQGNLKKMAKKLGKLDKLGRISPELSPMLLS